MNPDLPPHYDPGAPLPNLPGHSSGGRLERILRSGRFRRYGEDP